MGGGLGLGGQSSGHPGRITGDSLGGAGKEGKGLLKLNCNGHSPPPLNPVVGTNVICTMGDSDGGSKMVCSDVGAGVGGCSCPVGAGEIVGRGDVDGAGLTVGAGEILGAGEVVGAGDMDGAGLVVGAGDIDGAGLVVGAAEILGAFDMDGGSVAGSGTSLG